MRIKNINQIENINDIKALNAFLECFPERKAELFTRVIEEDWARLVSSGYDVKKLVEAFPEPEYKEAFFQRVIEDWARLVLSGYTVKKLVEAFPEPEYKEAFFQRVIEDWAWLVLGGYGVQRLAQAFPEPEYKAAFFQRVIEGWTRLVSGGYGVKELVETFPEHQNKILLVYFVTKLNSANEEERARVITNLLQGMRATFRKNVFDVSLFVISFYLPNNKEAALDQLMSLYDEEAPLTRDEADRFINVGVVDQIKSIIRTIEATPKSKIDPKSFQAFLLSIDYLINTAQDAAQIHPVLHKLRHVLNERKVPSLTRSCLALFSANPALLADAPDSDRPIVDRLIEEYRSTPSSFFSFGR